MAVPTAADVADAARALWAATPSLAATVPAARVYTGRAAEGTPLPYAVLACQDDAEERLCGRTVLLTWTLTATVYDASDPPLAAPLLARLVEALVRRGSPLAVPGAARTLPARRLGGGEARPTAERRGGRDIVSAAARVRVACEAKR